MDAPRIEVLTRVVGAGNILIEPYDLDRYSADALSPWRAFGAESAFERIAEVVVRPGSVREVSEVVRLANEWRVPVIPYGGGTGVMGGVLPVEGGMVVDVKRLNRILSISPQDMTARVEAGVVLEDLYDALAEHGLMPGHDPYSVPIATVAGTISTNGVGYRAAAFGPMGEQVTALEVVTPTGQVISTREVPKNSTGPDLNRLFIGSEGVFGIITKATVKVFRKPEAEVFAAAAFDSFDRGFEAVGEMMALGIRPTLLDLTEEDGRVKLYLLFEGFREGVAANHQRTMRICKEFGGKDIGPEPTLDYWEYRHESAENFKRTALDKPREVRWNRQRGRSFDYLHLALPISQVLEYRRRSETILAEHGARVVEYALWSRPELFSMMVVPSRSNDAGYRDRLGQGVARVLELAQDMGGIMEYCHGTGVKLNHLLARERGTSQDVIQSIKRALDPANIMNPGKLGL